jgi:hypothetical protein
MRRRRAAQRSFPGSPKDAAEFGMLDLRADVRVGRVDYPRRGEALPRFLPEPVMAGLEKPSIALLEDNGLRNLVVGPSRSLSLEREA